MNTQQRGTRARTEAGTLRSLASLFSVSSPFLRISVLFCDLRTLRGLAS
jgi:hypothetical protein